MRTCLHGRCGKQVTDDFVACRPHWLQLPVDIRKGLVRASAHNKTVNRKVTQVPENEVLMKAVSGQALEHWKSLEKKNASS